MRILHARPDHVGRRADCGGASPLRRRDPRADERQHLSLRSLHQYRGGHTGRDGRAELRWPERDRGALMIPFSYTRAQDEQQALTAHDAQSEYLAGGTTLLDLMKLNVQNPAHLVDINALPMGRIETLP